MAAAPLSSLLRVLEDVVPKVKRLSGVMHKHSRHLYTKIKIYSSSPLGIFSPYQINDIKKNSAWEKRIAAVHLQIIFGMRYRQRET